MNSKKKNKNRHNKPPNPTPPQKQDIIAEIAEPVEEKVETIVEERVPNIVSENIPPVTEVTDVQSDSPKKPKRNRGKKKKENDGDKSDKESTDVKDEESACDVVLEDKPSQAEPDKGVLDEANITPTARKKKNKNKKSQDQSNLGQNLEDNKDSTAKDQVDTKNVVPTEEKHDESVKPTEISDQDTKSNKKKNKKKKNRNDSEKSDKGEDVISCTSAFQKLLGESEKSDTLKETEKSDQKTTEPKDVKVENKEPPKDDSNKNKKKNKKDKKNITEETPTKQTTEIKEEEEKVAEEIVKDVSDETSKALQEVPSTSITSELEDKNPKLKAKIAKPVDKKKKGKINTETSSESKGEEVSENNPETADSMPVLTPISESTSNVISDENTHLQIENVLNQQIKSEIDQEGNGPVIGCDDKTETTTSQVTNNVLKTQKPEKRKKSPKPSKKYETVQEKDKIIEETKKTEEITCTEGRAEQVPVFTHDIASNVDMILEDPKPITTKDEEEKPVDNKPITETKQDEESQLIAPASIETTPAAISVVDDTIKISDISIAETSSVKKEDILDVEKKAHEDTMQHIGVQSGHGKSKKRKKSPMPSKKIDDIPAPVSSIEENTQSIEIPKEIQSQKAEPKLEESVIISEKILDESQCSLQQKEAKSDHEKNKKGKKSPKPPKVVDTPVETKMSPENVEAQSTLFSIPEDNKSRSVVPDILTIEGEATKSKTLASPSDATPDFVEYPRAGSEQLFDTNNNTVIQEISGVDVKSDIPIEIPESPIIQTVDTPTPETGMGVASGVNVTEIPQVKSADEKMDLKSKVMEVNQDMEELRMSIERSLAELTSMEKNDQETERKIEEERKRHTEISERLEIETNVSEIPLPVLMKLEKSETEETAKSRTEETLIPEPVCPSRKDNKGKGKSKKKGKHEPPQSTSASSTVQSSSPAAESTTTTQSQDTKKEETKKTEQKSDTEKQEKQQTDKTEETRATGDNVHSHALNKSHEYEPIENFEDAMTSSADDVNKSFEMIVNEANDRVDMSKNNPEINVIAPQEDSNKASKQEKQNPVSQPKNLLGHPDIPVPSSRTDYKKEKNKTPNYRQAKVKIKDSVEIETAEKSGRHSKESQTINKRRFSNNIEDESVSCITNGNEDYVYKYSFRKVFLQSACQVCKKDLRQARVPCNFCNLVFYCNQKHRDEDYTQHQALCFAVSTIGHLKDQKFIYADAQNITGHNYRLLRMQMIVSCEKVLKRKLVPWEQEALLYPRVCSDVSCREWRASQLDDCDGCGQISYCIEHPDHISKTHSRWCKSYNLYQKLVCYQQTKGRLEPNLPTRVLNYMTPIPDKINEVLASMYEEKIDMNDIQYAALTQLATAPLTAVYCHQLYTNKMNSSYANGVQKNSTFTLHIVGAELQFEADVLNKWEIFFLHLMPGIQELEVVLIGPDLNPSNLPLDLLGKIKFCENCQKNKRRVKFSFQDKNTYHEFWSSDDFSTPDLVCAFNPSIQRCSAYNGKDLWPSTINCILKLKVPFAITSYTLNELTRDLLRIKECARVDYNTISEAISNPFASVRPDRNFISDDEMPLLFKNYCFAVVCGVL